MRNNDERGEKWDAQSLCRGETIVHLDGRLNTREEGCVQRLEEEIGVCQLGLTDARDDR